MRTWVVKLLFLKEEIKVKMMVSGAVGEGDVWKWHMGGFWSLGNVFFLGLRGVAWVSSLQYFVKRIHS